jgi:DNA-binding response OmpR family regulator
MIFGFKEGRGKMKQPILVVDGDADCRDALRVCLNASGYDVAVLYEPAKVAKRLDDERPALVVMTSGAVLGSGLAALKELRRGGDDLPVIMLGERDDAVERIVALECGADDFITKPFNAYEVLARIRRVLARAKDVSFQAPALRPPFSFDGFELDFASRTLRFRGEAVPLSQREYAILNLFTSAPNQVLSRERIAQRIWPETPYRPGSVSAAVHRLRRVIESRAAVPDLIQTVRGTGYVFCSS